MAERGNYCITRSSNTKPWNSMLFEVYLTHPNQIQRPQISNKLYEVKFFMLASNNVDSLVPSMECSLSFSDVEQWLCQIADIVHYLMQPFSASSFSFLFPSSLNCQTSLMQEHNLRQNMGCGGEDNALEDLIPALMAFFSCNQRTLVTITNVRPLGTCKVW